MRFSFSQGIIWLLPWLAILVASLASYSPSPCPSRLPHSVLAPSWSSWFFQAPLSPSPIAITLISVTSQPFPGVCNIFHHNSTSFMYTGTSHTKGPPCLQIYHIFLRRTCKYVCLKSCCFVKLLNTVCQSICFLPNLNIAIAHNANTCATFIGI